MSGLAPGIGATFYGSLPTILDAHRDVIEASDLVCLHTSADASDVASAARVRALGCDRVWLGIPANYLVSRAARGGIPAAVAEGRIAAVAAGTVTTTAGRNMIEELRAAGIKAATP